MSDSAETADTGPAHKPASRYRPLFAVAAVLLGPFIVSFHSRFFAIGLADIKGALSLSFDEGAWLSTAGTASQIMIAPAVAWLASTVGIRRLFVAPTLLYTIVSLAIPFVRSYDLLLALHIVHGLCLGVFVPATMMVILRSLPPRWWLPAMALYAFRLAFTANAGISLVDVYVQALGWQWVYWGDALLAPLMALCACLGARSEPINYDLLRRADWGGMLLFGAGLTLLFAGLDQGNRLGWLSSGTVLALLCGGAALIAAFLVNEAVVPEPWAQASVIFSRNIGLMLLAALCFIVTSLSNVALIPNFLTTVRQLRPEQIGPLLLNYVALPLVLLVPIAVVLLRRIDARFVLVLGLSAFAAAGLLGTKLTSDWDPAAFVPVALFQSAGYGLTFLAIMVYAFANADPARATAFSAYIQVLRLGGAEIGVALITTWLRVREQTYSNLLGQHVVAGDAGVTQTLSRVTAPFLSHGSDIATARGLSTLAALVRREANVLAYIDGFWLTFWAALLGLMLVALMTSPPEGPFTPKTRHAPERVR
ncbi:MFS transporter [Bradyrhizobium sp. AUGA SZCCT0182]|uniref:MFS transporter n=1 Tax=Bradyrhizobium sp. AUGA SZCCT0182 TaxID=2807667 RepID=UPI001BAE0696|nr:MFS transporter [Bradyrhizobium sp. AUGA SZCCT0182]MBR1234365.1 MFS transporter [Bradyrhizobium sp. AUGA SZCCT0182]